MPCQPHGFDGSAARWLASCGLGIASAGCLSHEAHQPLPEPLAPASFAERTILSELIPERMTPRTSAGSRDEGGEGDTRVGPAGAAPGPGMEGRAGGDEPGDVRTLDLAQALAIGGANSLQVALARQELAEAHARLDQAEVLWLPNLWAGVGYDKHEGALQETEGNILQVSRNSGFVGGGILASFELADAMLEPRSARHGVDAASAGVTSSVNDALLAIALAYNDLLGAQAGLTLARENVSLAEELVELAEAFSRSGQGLEADAARARNELAHRRRLAVAREQSIETQSARLATLLRLDPRHPLRAGEPRLVPFALMREDVDLDGLVGLAMEARPEIRSLTAVVMAEEASERQEGLRPFLPRLLLGLRGGGLGGGTGSDFEQLGDEGELTAALIWGVRNLGFGESAVRRREAARTRRAMVRLEMARDSVAEEVTVAWLQAREGRRQVELAVVNVAESLDSLDLNMRRIRGAEGLPIEALQAIQAAATARDAYLDAVGGFNRSQFLLLRAVGRAARP